MAPQAIPRFCIPTKAARVSVFRQSSDCHPLIWDEFSQIVSRLPRILDIEVMFAVTSLPPKFPFDQDRLEVVEGIEEILDKLIIEHG
jgi:hypothetical protein